MARVTRTPGPGAEKLKVMLEGLANKNLKVGVVEALKYEDGTPVAYVAAIQEFGDPSRSIPPRPFFRPTASNRQGQWRQVTAQGARAIAAGTGTTDNMAEMLGLVAAGDVRHTISQIQEPPLTETTLRLRKLKRQGVKIGGKVVGEAHKAVTAGTADLSGVSTKPLVFDGVLIGAITHAVEDGAQ